MTVRYSLEWDLVVNEVRMFGKTKELALKYA